MEQNKVLHKIDIFLRIEIQNYIFFFCTVGMMQRHINMNASDLERANSVLKSRNEDLEETLKISEERLYQLQEEVSQLQEEFQSESDEFQRQIDSLTELLSEEELNKNELQRSLDNAIKSKQVLEYWK